MRARLHTTTTTRFALLGSIAAVLLAAGCEPDVGKPCGPDDIVDARVRQEPGSADLVQDLGLECETGLCASVDASRPFCTKRCETDLDCAADGFECRRLVNFGRLACREWAPDDDCPQDDGTPSDTPHLYCAPPLETARAVITKRDCDFARQTDQDLCAAAQQCIEGIDPLACESEGEEAP